MTTELATRHTISADLQEKALLGGDLSKLTSAERLSLYSAVCESLRLNPLTRPFEYLNLQGKLVFYARKDCTEQLRTSRHVSTKIVSRELVDGIFVVTAQASMPDVMMPDGMRYDESIGAVPLPTSPIDKANAMMKAETKAKRRVTLSICGLNVIDESEIETIRGAKVVTGEGTPPLPTGAEMLARMEAKAPEPSVSVLEPTTEEVMEDLEKAAAMSMPTPGNPPSIFGFTDKLDASESIKEWSDVMNDAQRYDWNAEQRTRLDDHAQRAKKRLTTKRVK